MVEHLGHVVLETREPLLESVAVADAGGDGVAIDEVERLRKGRGILDVAGAGRLAAGATEEIEEVIGDAAIEELYGATLLPLYGATLSPSRPASVRCLPSKLKNVSAFSSRAAATCVMS